jgi:hypothetical protein
VKCFGWYEDQSFYFIAMEYAEHGDLNKHLMNSTPKPALEQIKEIIYQILKGLVVLHGKDICHRDLKPQVCTPWFRVAMSLEWWADTSVEYPYYLVTAHPHQTCRFWNI